MLALLLLGNAYAAAVLWTFTQTEPRPAQVVECRDSGGNARCHGEWSDASGQPEQGRIIGLNRMPDEDTVEVRVGPLGAYKDESRLIWPRMIFPAALDAGALFALTIIPVVTYRGARVVRRLRDEAAVGAKVMTVSRKSVDDADGRPLWTIEYPGSVESELRSSQGLPLYRMEGQTMPLGPRVLVRRSDGSDIGEIRQLGMNDMSGKPSYELYDAQRQLLGRADLSKLLDPRQEFFRPDGTPLGTFVASTRYAVRVEPPAHENVTVLLVAFAMSQWHFAKPQPGTSANGPQTWHSSRPTTW